MNSREARLLKDLERLAELLDRDAQPKWAKHFRETCNNLGYAIQSGAPRGEKAKLTAPIRSVFGGMGSFSDNYRSEDVRQLAAHVFDESFMYQESNLGA